MRRDACWLSVVAIVVLGVASADAFAQPGAGSQAPRPAETDSPVVTTRELFADPAQMSEGTNVRLDNGVIRAKSGNVLRVAFGKREIFVVPNDPSELNFLAIGARVDVQGTLRQAPSARQAQLIYAMEACEARRLARTRFFVDAWDVSAVD